MIHLKYFLSRWTINKTFASLKAHSSIHYRQTKEISSKNLQKHKHSADDWKTSPVFTSHGIFLIDPQSKQSNTIPFRDVWPLVPYWTFNVRELFIVTPGAVTEIGSFNCEIDGSCGELVIISGMERMKAFCRYRLLISIMDKGLPRVSIYVSWIFAGCSSIIADMHWSHIGAGFHL